MELRKTGSLAEAAVLAGDMAASHVSIIVIRGAPADAARAAAALEAEFTKAAALGPPPAQTEEPAGRRLLFEPELFDLFDDEQPAADADGQAAEAAQAAKAAQAAGDAQAEDAGAAQVAVAAQATASDEEEEEAAAAEAVDHPPAEPRTAATETVAAKEKAAEAAELATEPPTEPPTEFTEVAAEEAADEEFRRGLAATGLLIVTSEDVCRAAEERRSSSPSGTRSPGRCSGCSGDHGGGTEFAQAVGKPVAEQPETEEPAVVKLGAEEVLDVGVGEAEATEAAEDEERRSSSPSSTRSPGRSSGCSSEPKSSDESWIASRRELEARLKALRLPWSDAEVAWMMEVEGRVDMAFDMERAMVEEGRFDEAFAEEYFSRCSGKLPRRRGGRGRKWKKLDVLTSDVTQQTLALDGRIEKPDEKIGEKDRMERLAGKKAQEERLSRTGEG